jgi:acetylornithine aminotransferase
VNLLAKNDYGDDYLQAYGESYMLNFGTPKLVLQRGSGSIVSDITGKEYIDLLGGIAVNTLGHANSELTEVISRQARRLMHVSNFFTTPEQVKLASKLADISSYTHQEASKTRVLLTNSGTESVEGALKLVKEHANKLRKPNAKVIALTGSFHGRSLGALSLTYKPKYREPFQPLIPNVEFIQADDLAALHNAFKTPVAGLFLEVIQGEAGIMPLNESFIQAARDLTFEHDALLCVDEVQTGIGRTGKWFAYQHHNITPDVITCAKGLGGGFPIGAIIAKGDAADIFGPGDHGTTFGGNPLACATALKVLEIIERDGLLNAISSRCEFVSDVVKNMGNRYIESVRGQGLLIALQLNSDLSMEVYSKALNQGVIVNPVNASSIRIAPALNIDLITLHKGLKLLDIAIREVFEGS